MTAFAAGEPDRARLAARYELVNLTNKPMSPRLVLAVRPYQVNPPTQFLNLAGGVSPIRALRWDGEVLSVNGAPEVFPLKPPDHVGLSTFDGGGFPDQPAPSSGAAASQVEDPNGFASAALVYQLRLPPRGRVAVGVASPLTGAAASTSWPDCRRWPTSSRSNRRLRPPGARSSTAPRSRCRPQGQAVVDTLRTALAQILMTREGPALQPGTRSYARSWIRDGAMISESLLRLGHEKTAADYLALVRAATSSTAARCRAASTRAAPIRCRRTTAMASSSSWSPRSTAITGDRARCSRRCGRTSRRAARYLETLRQSERTAANREPGAAPALRPAAAVDQPRGLLGQAGLLLLGRLLGPHRLPGRGRDRRGARQDRGARAAGAPARRVPRGPLLASLRAAADEARHRLHPRRGRPGRLRRDVDHDRAGARPRAACTCRAISLVATFERYWPEFSRRARRAP